MQALKLCNLGLLSSQDFIGGFDPEVFPLKDLRLHELLQQNQGLALNAGQNQNRQIHQQHLLILLSFCQNVLFNFDGLGLERFSDSEEFTEWLKMKLSNRNLNLGATEGMRSALDTTLAAESATNAPEGAYFNQSSTQQVVGSGSRRALGDKDDSVI